MLGFYLAFFWRKKSRDNQTLWVAKIEENIGREIIYLLFFYIWQIKKLAERKEKI